MTWAMHSTRPHWETYIQPRLHELSYSIEEWGHKSFRGGTKLYTPRYATTVKQGKAEYIRKASWKYSIASQRKNKKNNGPTTENPKNLPW